MKRTSSTGYMAGTLKSQKRPKPEFSITEKDLPAITEWKVGGKYTLTMDVEQVSASKGSEYDSPMGGEKEEHRARFKILGIDAQSGDTKNNEESDDKKK